MGPAHTSYTCSRQDCTFPTGGSCARAAEFGSPPTGCPHLTVLDESAPLRRAKPPEETQGTPWGGNELLPQDLARQLSGARPYVIAVLGERDCGKTTFLTSLFLHLARGGSTFPYRYAWSYTLKRIHALSVDAVRWDRDPATRAVPRTPRSDSARFLHLGLRPSSERDDRVLDVLFSDIDGEVVRDHAENATDETLRVMRFLPRADVVMFLVDGDRLFGDDGEVYQEQNRAIMARTISDLRASTRKPSIALVLTKLDRWCSTVKPPPQEKRLVASAWEDWSESIRALCSQIDRAQRAGHDVELFTVSAFPDLLPPDTSADVLAPLDFAMTRADVRRPIGLRSVPVAPGSPSFLFMGSASRGG